MWDLWWTKWHWGSFLRVLQFLLLVLIPPTTPYSSPPSLSLSLSLSGADMIGPVVADIASELGLTPVQGYKKIMQ
jgi:hypothetical protein